MRCLTLSVVVVEINGYTIKAGAYLNGAYLAGVDLTFPDITCEDDTLTFLEGADLRGRGPSRKPSGRMSSFR